jgi:hypothetical protein
MKTVRHLLTLIALLSLPLSAQTIFPIGMINGPTPPSANAVATVGGTPGISQYLYVVVVHYPNGDVPSNVIPVNNGNAVLSGTNDVVISWPAVQGALNYDVLKVTTNPFSYASCTCALSASATSALTLTDTGASLNAYTAGTLIAPVISYFNLDNYAFDGARLRVSTNGSFSNVGVIKRTTAPLYCSQGDFWINTTTNFISVCGPTNVWSPLGVVTVTQTNCNSSASPAVCVAARAGSVTVAASATTEVVNTTAVTANSQIFLQFDSSLGTRLGVTCNTTEPTAYNISARTAATSFTITSTAPTTNPACFSYLIVN